MSITPSEIINPLDLDEVTTETTIIPAFDSTTGEVFIHTVDSNIQEQLDSKADTADITDMVTAPSNLATNKIVLGNGNDKTVKDSGVGIEYLVPTGSILSFGGAIASLPTGFLACNGSAVSRTTYPSLFSVLSSSKSVTLSIATPAVITCNEHGLNIGSQIQFTTTGALPTGVNTTTTYFVISAGFTANSFQISATENGAAINTSGTQSGVHTFINFLYGATNSTTFNLPDFQGRSPKGVGTSSGGSDVPHVEEIIVLATKYNDKMQGHQHNFKTLSSPSLASLGQTSGGGSDSTQVCNGSGGSVANVLSIGDPTADGTNGTPRIGNITTGKTLGVNFIIKH